MDYRLVRYQSEFIDQIARLQTGLWSPDLATNVAYFEWKYQQNPYVSEPHIYLALENDRVVAMRGFYGSQWAIGESGQILTLPCAGDTIIAPEHRRHGLLRQMLQFEQSEFLAPFPYALSLSASPRVYFCALSEGWRAIGPYNALARPSPIQSLLKSKRLKKWIQKRHAAVTKLWRAASYLRSTLPRGRIQISSNLRAEDMAALVARTAKRDKIHHLKDSRYFAWRFRSPLSRYRFFYWQDTALEGFLVVRRPYRAKIGPVQLADWAVSDPEVFAKLLEAALYDAALGGMQTWSATLPESVTTALVERGFAPVESSREAGYHPSLLAHRKKTEPNGGTWNLAGLDISDVNNWDLRMASSDQY
jgi:hypothetical protein